MTSYETIPYEVKTSIIRIYTYQDRNPTGTIYNPYLRKNAVFRSLMEMLIIIEKILDAMPGPRPYMERRSFWPEPEEIKEEAAGQLQEDQKSMVTFQIKVMFRQNASWQGSLLWIDKNREIQFRSVLEMIRLMDEVLINTISIQPGQRDHKT